MLKTRTLGRSGLELTELGLGCATFAFDAAPAASRSAQEMMRDAHDNGIAYFDTAPFYGRGLSERLVGDVLRTLPKMLLSSKVGRLLIPDASASTAMPFRVEFDYTYDGIMRSVEHSYQRLGLSSIDILYVHDLGHGTHGENAPAQFSAFIDGGGYRAMDELRSTGVVSAIGLGVNEVAVCELAMKYGSFDVLLLAGRHTLLERTGALPFLDKCAQVGTDIVVGGPFNSGMLVGGSTYNYRAIPEAMAARHKVLVNYCNEYDVEIGAAALQFPLRHASVKSVIPGPKTPQELTQILHWYKASIPDAFWSGLETLSD